MSVRMRLRRIGKKKHPCYRLAVVDSRVKRDGRFVEFVGHYDPMTQPHTIKLKEERIIEWLENGATYSDTVGSLLRQSGLLSRWHEKKTGQKAQEEAAVKEEKKKEKAEAAPKKKTAARGKKTAKAKTAEADKEETAQVKKEAGE